VTDLAPDNGFLPLTGTHLALTQNKIPDSLKPVLLADQHQRHVLYKSTHVCRLARNDAWSTFDHHEPYGEPAMIQILALPFCQNDSTLPKDLQMCRFAPSEVQQADCCAPRIDRSGPLCRLAPWGKNQCLRRRLSRLGTIDSLKTLGILERLAYFDFQKAKSQGGYSLSAIRVYLTICDTARHGRPEPRILVPGTAV
jgi:hypothetical protein